MVKPESLLWPLLSSSGLELGLLEEAEAGPVSGSENTSAGRVAPRSGRSGWAWTAGLGPAPRSSPSLETRTKSSAPGRSRRPGAAGGACKEVKARGGAVRGRWAGPGSSRGLGERGDPLRGLGLASLPPPRPAAPPHHSCAPVGQTSGHRLTRLESRHCRPLIPAEPRGLPGQWGGLGGSTDTWTTGKGPCKRARSCQKGSHRALCCKSTLKAQRARFENAFCFLKIVKNIQFVSIWMLLFAKVT